MGVKFCEASFKICSLNFRMVYARNLYIDFLAKFALRALAEPDALSTNLRTELLISARFRSAIYEPDLRQPALSHSIPPRAFTLFSRFFASLRTHLRLFPARAPRLNSVASLAQSVAAMSGHAPRRRIFACFLRTVVRGYFQNFTQNSKTACTYIRAAVINARLRAQTKYLRDTAQEMKFRRRLSKRVFAAAVRYKILKW